MIEYLIGAIFGILAFVIPEMLTAPFAALRDAWRWFRMARRYARDPREQADWKAAIESAPPKE